MDQNAAAKATVTSGVMTINSEKTSANKAWRVEYGGDTFDNNNGTVKFAFNGFDSRFSMRSEGHANNAFHNLIIHHLGDTRTLGIDNGSKLIVDNDLTITRGILQMNTAHELEVGGNVEIDDGSDVAELRMGSASTASSHPATFGSLTMGNDGTYSATSGTTKITDEATDGVCLRSNGTFTHNGGLVSIETADHTTLVWSSASQRFNNLTVNLGASARVCTLSGQFDSHRYVEGDFIVTNCKFDTNNALTFRIDGDVSLTSSATLTCGTSTCSFGSLEIASGTTLSASSGTTTITTGGTIGGTTNTAFGGEGTFTHNNGTLVLDSVLHRIPKGGTFYNLKLTGSQSTGGIYLYSDTMLPQGIMPDGTTGSAYFSVLGTLEITEDEFRPYNADKVYIHNLVIGDGTGSANSAKFDFAEVDEFDGKVFVDNVTIHSDGQLLFGDGNETSATEGSSALNIYGAFRNLGGNVTIE
jgi:hypothetical protein